VRVEGAEGGLSAPHAFQAPPEDIFEQMKGARR
jgi:hypothetical protein